MIIKISNAVPKIVPIMIYFGSETLQAELIENIPASS